MLEELRIFVMERHYRMSMKAQEWESVVCPAIRKKLKKWGKYHRYWDVILSGGNVFETQKGCEAMVVYLDARKCTCRLWDIAGIPCVHSIAAIYSIKMDPDDYVSKWFTKDLFKMAYENPIKLLNGSNMWTPTSFIKPCPPKERRMPGRPSIKRKRSESESQCTRVSQSGKTMTCRNCLETGLNARSCKNEKKDPPPKPLKPKGRPKLNIPKPTTTRRCSSGGRGNRGGRGNVGGRIPSNTSSRVPQSVCPAEIVPCSTTSEVVVGDREHNEC